MDSPAYLVVSGLPGSGKSTLARGLAARLGMAVIDKDVILESLYDSLGVGPEPWRHRLSRAADDILFAQAALTPRAVLDNWWHPDTAPARLHGLSGAAGRLVQVHCDCDAAVAAARLGARRRGRRPAQLTRSARKSSQVLVPVSAPSRVRLAPLR